MLAEDEVLDLRGLKCPLPALRTRKRLAGMRPGGVLVVEATDPMSAIDIPNMARENGDSIEAAERDGTVLRFRIRKA
jgi:tRNA 2-thiouridine synthesizing protein A